MDGCLKEPVGSEPNNQDRGRCRNYCTEGMRLPVQDAVHIRAAALHLPAHRTRPPSMVVAPLILMSTLLSRAPLSSVTVARIRAFALTVRSQMEPPAPSTREGS